MSNKTIVKIQSQLEMLGFLKSNGTQCRFVTIVTKTEVKNIKAGCPYKGVIKTSRKQGMINVNYNSAVRSRIADILDVPKAEVEYTNGKSAYQHLLTVDGKALPVLVKASAPDDGVFYLQYFPTKGKTESVFQMPDGTIIDEEKIKPYYYEKTATYKPNVIAPKLSNIHEIRASGVIMQSEDIAEAQALLATAE